MKIAYADPPYFGCSHYYPEHQEVDHDILLDELQFGKEHYDGWALSCSVPSVRLLLNHKFIGKSFDNGRIRLAAWVKPFASFKPNVNPAYAWEPVIFKPAREKRDRKERTVRDWLAENITMKKGLVGAKPVKFCYWLFELLGMEAGDEFHDLFPGTGIVTKCWNEYQIMKSHKQTEMELELK